jgi:hypothetical protein
MIVNVRTRQLQVEGSTRSLYEVSAVGKRQCSAEQAGMVCRVSWDVRGFYTEEREMSLASKFFFLALSCYLSPSLHGRMESN